MTEIWKPVVGYEGLYSVSTWGRVRAEDKPIRVNGGGIVVKKRRMLKPGSVDGVHLMAMLSKNNRQRGFLVHRLVLTTFRGPCPEGMQACHKNGVGWYNLLHNLRWGTPKSNCEDRDEHGTVCRGE